MLVLQGVYGKHFIVKVQHQVFSKDLFFPDGGLINVDSREIVICLATEM